MRITLLSVLVIGLISFSHARNTKIGDATWYNLGLTACGQTYRDSDFVAAVAFNYFTYANPNYDPMCGKIALVYDPRTKRSVTVRIKDKCEGCSNGDIDLSPAAFQRLRGLGLGRFTVYWKIIN